MRSVVRPSAFLKSVGILTSGVVVAQMIAIITLPLVSRLYDPADFGEYAVIASAALLLTAVSSLGLQHAIVTAPDDGESRRIISTAILASLVISAVITFGALLIDLDLAGQNWQLPYWAVCLLVWLMALFTTAHGALRAYANRLGSDKSLFANSILSALATLFVTLPLGFLGAGAIGLIAGSLIGLLVGSVQMLVRLRPFAALDSLDEVWRIFAGHRPFVFFQYPANLLETLAMQLPRQILNVVYGGIVVGQYAMTERLLGAPIRLLGGPIGTVFFREADRLHKAGGTLLPLTFNLVTRIMAVSFVPIVVMVFWGEALFGIVLGPQWRLAGKFASVLVIQYVFILMKTSVGTVRIVLGQQGVNLAMSGARVFIETCALVLGAYLTRDPFWALVYFCLASSACHIVDMALTLKAVGGTRMQPLFVNAMFISSVIACWVIKLLAL